MTTRVLSFYGTTIGKKVVMATSGLIVVGWLVLHMLGHVAAFAGRDAYNEYAAFLADRPPLLWGQRIVMIVALSAHIHAAFSLWARNSEARPKQYMQRKDIATNYAALTMRYGGLVLLSFIIYHVLHLTVGMTSHLGYEFRPGDVYNNLVLGFQRPAVAGFYILAQCALGMHLFHGIWSLTQTLGLDHPKYNPLRQLVSAGLTLVIVLGFISVPVSVLTGVLRPVGVNEAGESTDEAVDARGSARERNGAGATDKEGLGT
jgi:succinate dehydrogenase / fumarate reductase cytochrome b subunit